MIICQSAQPPPSTQVTRVRVRSKRQADGTLTSLSADIKRIPQCPRAECTLLHDHVKFASQFFEGQCGDVYYQLPCFLLLVFLHAGQPQLTDIINGDRSPDLLIASKYAEG